MPHVQDLHGSRGLRNLGGCLVERRRQICRNDWLGNSARDSRRRWRALNWCSRSRFNRLVPSRRCRHTWRRRNALRKSTLELRTGGLWDWCRRFWWRCLLLFRSFFRRTGFRGRFGSRGRFRSRCRLLLSLNKMSRSLNSPNASSWGNSSLWNRRLRFYRWTTCCAIGRFFCGRRRSGSFCLWCNRFLNRLRRCCCRRSSRSNRCRGWWCRSRRTSTPCTLKGWSVLGWNWNTGSWWRRCRSRRLRFGCGRSWGCIVRLGRGWALAFF
mmetsp:Transcript_5848/g.14311  ORF Transcript_5848/g.14311 Transcript_5848/m.14311 type:complete len:268 (+) Transcript_5848:3181-3984(+)